VVGIRDHDADRPPVLVVEEASQASRMSAEQVAIIPECVECERPWLPADEERWRAYLTDHEPPQIAFYCPRCAERESPPERLLALYRSARAIADESRKCR
jgi:hypothetical protein